MVENITELSSWKVVLGVLTTILLGALGSGLWSLAIEPTARKLISIIGRIATLGINSEFDKLYRRMARGERAVAQKYIIQLTIMAILFPTLIIILGGHFREKRIDVYSNIYKQVSETNIEIKEDEIAKIYEARLVEYQKKQSRVYQTILILSSMLLIGTIVFDYMKSSFINYHVQRFGQLVDFLWPYVEEGDIKLLKSKFASMSNSDDYKEVCEFMEGLALSNDVDLSKLPPYF